MLVTIFQSVPSANAVFINEEKDKVTAYNYKDYIACTIKSESGSVSGRAFLFPGFCFSGWWFDSGHGVYVVGASGILIGVDSDWSGVIYFNDDHYWNDGIRAYVISFFGYFSNQKNFLLENVFEINGIALFVRVYYL